MNAGKTDSSDFRVAAPLPVPLERVRCCGPLDTLRVDSPLDESEITLPIQKGYGQLAGTSAYFRTKQTPRDLYQPIKRWRRRKGCG